MKHEFQTGPAIWTAHLSEAAIPRNADLVAELAHAKEAHPGEEVMLTTAFRAGVEHATPHDVFIVATFKRPASNT